MGTVLFDSLRPGRNESKRTVPTDSFDAERFRWYIDRQVPDPASAGVGQRMREVCHGGKELLLSYDI